MPICNTSRFSIYTYKFNVFCITLFRKFRNVRHAKRRDMPLIAPNYRRANIDVLIKSEKKLKISTNSG